MNCPSRKTPRAPARAGLPLLRFRPGGVGLGGATRGATAIVWQGQACQPTSVRGFNGGQQSFARINAVECHELGASNSRTADMVASSASSMDTCEAA